MGSQRKRFLLFLVGCLFAILGTYMMVFGDSRLANSIGGIFAGMGMIFNCGQMLFKFPLERSQKETLQESGILLPSSHSPKQQPGELILPASYYHSLRKRQQAQRDHIVTFVSILAFLTPLVGIIYLSLLLENSSVPLSCTVVTKQIEKTFDGRYWLDFTVNAKRGSGSYVGNHDAYLGTGPEYYNTLQAAQEKLNHFLIGRTYACHYPVAEGSTEGNLTPYLLLDSDRPLSFSLNRGSGRPEKERFLC